MWVQSLALEILHSTGAAKKGQGGHTYNLFSNSKVQNLFSLLKEFPGGLVVKTWYFHNCSSGSILGVGTEIPYQAAASYDQK